MKKFDPLQWLFLLLLLLTLIAALLVGCSDENVAPNKLEVKWKFSPDYTGTNYRIFVNGVERTEHFNMMDGTTVVNTGDLFEIKVQWGDPNQYYHVIVNHYDYVVPWRQNCGCIFSMIITK